MSLFAKRLTELIESKGISRRDLAKALKLQPPTITYYLGNREPSYDKLIEIADYFEVSIDYLLGRDENKTGLDKALSEHIDDLIGQSDEMKRLNDTYSIKGLFEIFYRNMIDITNTQIPGIEPGELFEGIKYFVYVVENMVKIGNKLSNQNYEIFDELFYIRRFMNNVDITVYNWFLFETIKSMYENDTIEQSIKGRIEAKTSTSYTFIDKRNKSRNSIVIGEMPPIPDEYFEKNEI